MLEQPALPPPRANKSGMHNRGKGGGPGHAPKYPSAEAMQGAIDRYFLALQITEDPPTIADLVLALGFKCRQSFLNYRERGEDYEFVVDTALTRIEGFKNRLLLKGGPTTQAAIFDLKNNHKWSDKMESTTNVVPGGSLAELVQALQGQVLRPVIDVKKEDIEDAEFAEEDAEPETEELTFEPVEEPIKPKGPLGWRQELLATVVPDLMKSASSDAELDDLV